MGLFGGDSTSVSTSNQTDNKATTQTGTAVSTAGGVANITDGGAHKKSVEAFTAVSKKTMDLTQNLQAGIFKQTNKLIDTTNNLLQRKSESDSKELSEKALKIVGILGGLWFLAKVFK